MEEKEGRKEERRRDNGVGCRGRCRRMLSLTLKTGARPGVEEMESEGVPQKGIQYLTSLKNDFIHHL